MSTADLGHVHGEGRGATRHGADIAGRGQAVVIDDVVLTGRRQQLGIARRGHLRNGAEREMHARRAFDGNLAVGQGEIEFRRLQLLCRDLQDLVAHHRGGFVDGMSRHDGGSAGVASAAIGQ